MKRIFAIILALSLLFALSACGKKPVDTPVADNPTQPSADKPAEPSEQPSEEPSQEPSEEPSEEPSQEVQLLYQNPLNGQAIAEPYTSRPVAIVINNIEPALPQYGIGQADFIYELVTEGGITRCLAIFSDVSNVGTIGPIRSTRTFFNNAAVSFNAPLVHCGGSVRGIVGYHDLTGSKISPWEHIDEQYNGKYFYRDQQRLSDGYATEHCLFITGEKLAAAMAAKEYATEEAWDLGLQFREDALTGGSAANNVTVSFLGGKKTGFQYDSATKLYKASQYGSALIDGINGDQLAFKNILVLTTAQSHKSEGRYVRSYYDMVGQGEGYLMCDGQMITLRWERESLEEPFRFTDANGNPITLGVGKTYMAIVSTKATAPKCE